MNEADRPVIGILGGMGPRSTAPFLDMIVDECQQQLHLRTEADYPEMMVLSWPTPFDSLKPFDYEAIRTSVIKGLQKLESAGVDFISMPCNTAHVFFDELQAALAVPLLNMIAITCRSLPEDGPVALFSTRAMRDSRVYEHQAALRGITVLRDHGLDTETDRLIADIKVAPDPHTLTGRWLELIERAASLGARSALVGCTDLNAVTDRTAKHSIRVIDATRMLARATVLTWGGMLIEG